MFIDGRDTQNTLKPQRGGMFIAGRDTQNTLLNHGLKRIARISKWGSHRAMENLGEMVALCLLYHIALLWSAGIGRTTIL